MISDDDFVVITPEKTPESEEPSPAPAPMPKEGEERTYKEFVYDCRPCKTYSVNGIHYYIKNGVSSDVVREMMKGHGGCVTCCSRVKKFSTLIGPVAKDDNIHGSVFLRNIRGFRDGGCEDGCLFNIRKKIEEINGGHGSKKQLVNPKVFLVKQGTFPQVKEGKNEETNEFYEHITIVPDAVTSMTNVIQYEPLITQYMDTIGPRLVKLCNPDAVNSVELIHKRLNELARPDHWSSVFTWVMGLQEKARSSEHPFEKLKVRDKLHISMYAITTGRSEVGDTYSIHKDYHQSSNIVDFITMESVDDVLREMDTRSNPENYMVSQLNRRMVKENVTSDYTISLSWDEKYTDDLDLHVKPISPNYPEIYYQRKKVKTTDGMEYRLDFDANVNKGEKAPCENISVGPGTFAVYVNNYTRRTFNQPIPFTVILRQKGIPDKIIDGFWGALRTSGNKILVVTHQFTEVCKNALEMSKKEANRAESLNTKWMNAMGDPRSEIPSIESMGIPYHVWEKQTYTTSFKTNTNSFMELAKAAKNGQKNRKKYLSEHEKERMPSTLSGLLTKLSDGEHKVGIYPRDFSPGYVTKVITKEKVTKGSDYAMCHYKDKFSIPVDPIHVKSYMKGNARFNGSWFKSGILENYVDIEGFIYIDSMWFMVIPNTKLPYNDSDFPLGGGFRPTDLTANFHDLRDRWTFCNTTVKPTITQTGTPMIGAFLTSETINLTINGEKVTVKVE